MTKKIILSLAFMMACSLLSKPISSFGQSCTNPEENTSFEGNIYMKAFVESNRKDYFDAVYSYDNPVPRYEKKQYDKSFYGTDSDLFFVLKTDLNDTSFLDFRESLYVRHYNEEDPKSLDYSSNRHNEIDHNFNMTFGLSLGIFDYVQLDYTNNIFDGGFFDSLNYRSNKGRVLVTHDIAERTCLAISGTYEERSYDTDKTLNFKEGRASIEISSLLPGSNEYVQIANSSRGERSTFENTPTGMDTRRAVDYYTTYVKNPRDNDPTAKYILNQTRGELYIRAFSEMSQRERTELKNNCNEIVGGFETIYRTDNNMRVRLNEVYTDQDFDKESNINNLHDGHSNYLALTFDYDCTNNFSQSLTYSNELYKYKKASDENNKANSITYDCYYAEKHYRASFVVGTTKRAYNLASEVTPDETENRVAVCCDYDIIESLVFKFKAEYADIDYHDFEDELFSNYKRKTWRLAIEKDINEALSVEAAFQSNSEKHKKYNQNNIEEKTVGVSVVGKF